MKNFNLLACHCEDVAIAKSLNTKMSLRTERSGVSQSHHNEITTSKTSFSPRNDKKAFTLAEVLITLGVIGVVAAMTLPTLIQNYQKHVWVNQLKKSYSILNQGFKKILADEGVFLLSQTEIFQSMNGQKDMRDDNDEIIGYLKKCDGNLSKCEAFFNNLKKYFKIISIKNLTDSDNYIPYSIHKGKTSYVNPLKSTVLYLYDGTMIYDFYFYSQDPYNMTNNEMNGVVGIFYIDLNGIRQPNQSGRDIFRFYLGDNGIIYPAGSKVVSKYEYGGDEDRGYWGNDFEPCPSERYKGYAGDGITCTARILETGKMDY